MLLPTKAALILLSPQAQGQTQKQAHRAGKFLQKKVLTAQPEQLVPQVHQVQQVLKVESVRRAQLEQLVPQVHKVYQ
jgi:gluconate kinase